MKLDKEIFKSLIKESIQEMIESGSFDFIADSVLETIAVVAEEYDGDDVKSEELNDDDSLDADVTEAFQIKHKPKRLLSKPKKQADDDPESSKQDTKNLNEIHDQASMLASSAVLTLPVEKRKMFQDIFEHTARTTLLQQGIKEGISLPGSQELAAEEGQAAMEQLKQIGDPTRWAKLAFSNKK